jgi:hypothetical protein
MVSGKARVCLKRRTAGRYRQHHRPRPRTTGGGGTGHWPPLAGWRLAVGDDSRFCALLGSTAPQELITARPEAKLTC